MSPGTKKHQKRTEKAKKHQATPKSDMLMSEDMKQGLLSEHNQHHAPTNKDDVYRKKINYRPGK